MSGRVSVLGKSYIVTRAFWLLLLPVGYEVTKKRYVDTEWGWWDTFFSPSGLSFLFVLLVFYYPLALKTVF